MHREKIRLEVNKNSVFSAVAESDAFGTVYVAFFATEKDAEDYCVGHNGDRISQDDCLWEENYYHPQEFPPGELYSPVAYDQVGWLGRLLTHRPKLPFVVWERNDYHYCKTPPKFLNWWRNPFN